MRTEQWQRIHALHAQLASVRAVATYLGLHRRTVREALRSDRPPRQTPAARGSLIDPYRGWLLAKLEQYPELTAARLLQMLREQKYSGGYSVVIITTNRPYKQWARTFANDATLASAVLDRVVHHCETVIIEGKSYRLKGRVGQDETPDLE